MQSVLETYYKTTRLCGSHDGVCVRPFGHEGFCSNPPLESDLCMKGQDSMTTDRPTTWGTYDVTIFSEGGPSHEQMTHAMLESFIDAHPEVSLRARCVSQPNAPEVARNLDDDDDESA